MQPTPFTLYYRVRCVTLCILLSHVKPMFQRAFDRRAGHVAKCELSGRVNSANTHLSNRIFAFPFSACAGLLWIANYSYNAPKRTAARHTALRFRLISNRGVLTSINIFIENDVGCGIVVCRIDNCKIILNAYLLVVQVVLC